MGIQKEMADRSLPDRPSLFGGLINLRVRICAVSGGERVVLIAPRSRY